jgi:hypothetical protein
VTNWFNALDFDLSKAITAEGEVLRVEWINPTDRGSPSGSASCRVAAALYFERAAHRKLTGQQVRRRQRGERQSGRCTII